MDNYLLKLYITGRTVRTERAIFTMQRLCDENLKDHYELVIIDVLEKPHLAEMDKVLATPTLIRELPLPRRRIIGDLSDTQKILNALGLDTGSAGESV
ncbi:MAG: circadian clock protein KaiB [Chloroflexi bacterium]|nr:circadian clock protein KaiB [Chloroflexota bacterium]